MKSMRRLTFVPGLLVLVVLMVSGRPAGADVPPPDACTAPGQPCNNAGPNHDQAGTCTMSTCTRSVPSADGGRMPMSYDCNLCKVANAGTGGAGGGTGSGGAGGGTGSGGAGGAKPPAPRDSGCALGGGPETGAPGSVLVLTLAGLLGLGTARRRRS